MNANWKVALDTFRENYHFNYLHRRTLAKYAHGGVLTFDSRHADLWQILPVAADPSEVVHTSYLRPGLSEDERATMAEMAPWICETVVDGGEFWVAGRTEPALRCVLETVVFGRNDRAAASAPWVRGGAGGCRG